MGFNLENNECTECILMREKHIIQIKSIEFTAATLNSIAEIMNKGPLKGQKELAITKIKLSLDQFKNLKQGNYKVLQAKAYWEKEKEIILGTLTFEDVIIELGNNVNMNCDNDVEIYGSKIIIYKGGKCTWN